MSTSRFNRHWVTVVIGVSLFGLALMAAMGACGPSNIYTMPEATEAGAGSMPGAGTGELVVALANDRYFGLIEWGMHQLGTEFYRKVSTGPIIGSRAQLDWTEPPEKIVIVNLPAGQWEFFQWAGYQISSSRMSIRFAIEPGMVNYIGRIYVRQEGLMGYEVVIEDTWERDRMLIDAKLPGRDPQSYLRNIAYMVPVQ